MRMPLLPSARPPPDNPQNVYNAPAHPSQSAQRIGQAEGLPARATSPASPAGTGHRLPRASGFAAHRAACGMTFVVTRREPESPPCKVRRFAGAWACVDRSIPGEL